MAINATASRQDNMVFPRAKLVQEGGENIDLDLSNIKNALLTKDGLVDDAEKENFRFFIDSCLNKDFLDQCGGEMSSFNRDSFR